MGGTVLKRYFGVDGLQFCLEIHSVEGADRDYVLLKNGQELDGDKVERKTLQLLECLTSHSQNIVSRTKVVQEVWGREAATSGAVDPGGSIDRHVSRLRKVFEEDADSPRFIKTEPRTGHKFLLPVRDVVEQIPSSSLTTAEVRGVLNVLKMHPCHRYHLTLDKKGKPVWIYTKIDFTKSEAAGEKLTTKAPVLLRADATDADRSLNMYDFEAEPYGSHLLIKSRRHDQTSDMCVDLYPHASTQYLPFCGARINDTWFPTTVASSVSIMNIGSVVEPKFESVKEGPVEQHDLVDELEKLWRENNKIVRLPTDWGGLFEAQEAVGRHPGELFKVGVPYYHYHLTLTKKGEQQWIGKIIKFDAGKNGHLFARTAILPDRGANPADHMYDVIPRFIGPHLLIQLVRSGDPDDVTVQVYPYTGTSRFPHLYSATINRSQTNTFVSSLAILSTEPLGGETEGPVDKEDETVLFDAWESHAETGSPKIVRLPLAHDKSSTKVSVPSTQSKDIVAHYVGNDFQASEYTSSQHPLLKQIRDTHVYSDGGSEQFEDHGTYDVLRAGITAFLTRPNTHFTWVVGHRVDRKYIEHVIESVEAAAKASGKSAAEIEGKITCKRLRSASAAVTNFLILDYKEEGKGKEVLFGWGHHSRGLSGKVFRSGDDAVVRELEASFTNLCSEEMSFDVPLRSLLQTYVPMPVSTVLSTRKQGEFSQRWDEHAMVEMLQRSPLDADIRIFVTFFVTDVDLFALILRLLTNSKRKITIMMLDPDARVLEMRYGTEEKPIRETLTAAGARNKITAQLNDLADIGKALQRRVDAATREGRQQDTGTLEVAVYWCAPTLVSYQTQDEMLVGTLLLHESANLGPMITVNKGEPMWDVIKKNWDTVSGVSTRRISAPLLPTKP